MHGNVYEWVHDCMGLTLRQPGCRSDRVRRARIGSYRGGSWARRQAMRSAERRQRPRVIAATSLGFRVGFQQITTHPSDLVSTAPLTIAENQPVGTVVGEFNATDPDAGATLTYHLVSGVGDTHNSFFTLDTNGTLKTATTFDYESNASSYAIRVQAKDEFNATVEGNFTVMLINANEPSTGSVTMSGTPVVGQTLTASNTLADADGLGAITYQWYRDGVPIVLPRNPTRWKRKCRWVGQSDLRLVFSGQQACLRSWFW